MPFRPITPAAPATPAPAAARSRIRPSSPPIDSETPASAVDPTPAPPRRHHVVDRSGPNWDENGDYLVGKYRPPKHSQWKPGQSGNRRGPEPRVKVDPETAMDDAILAEFSTTVNGQTVVTNLGLFALQILKGKAAQKDRKAAADLLNLYYDKMRARKPQQEDGGISPEEQAIIDGLLSAAGWEALPAIRAVRPNVDDEPDDE